MILKFLKEKRLFRKNLIEVSKTIGLIFLLLVIIGGIFWSGVEIGKKYYPSVKLIKGVKNAEEAQPPEVDFHLFWDAWRVLQEDYIKPAKLNPQEMVYGAIRGLVNSLGDPYTIFLKPDEAKKFTEDIKGSFGGIGIEIGMRKGILTVIAPLEDTPAWRAGLKAGDQIIKINDESTLDLTIDEAVKKIRGEEGTPVRLTILRKDFDQPKEFTIIREKIIVPSLKLKFLEDNIAHLKLLSFNENASYDFYQAALEIINKNSPGLILDLRNNPGGYLEVAVEIAGWFLEKGKVVVREIDREGKEKVLVTKGNALFSNLPLVVLVNEGSASASEILAGALRDQRGIKLIGEKTFGKGSVQTIEELKDKSQIKITIAEWLTPNGFSINDNGLSPDYLIEFSEEESQEEVDPQLNKALEILKQEFNL